MVESDIRKSQQVSVEVDPTNAIDTDDGNDEADYELWKLRELKRIKRDKEEREASVSPAVPSGGKGNDGEGMPVCSWATQLLVKLCVAIAVIVCANFVSVRFFFFTVAKKEFKRAMN